jgi:hypothetical protein
VKGKLSAGVGIERGIVVQNGANLRCVWTSPPPTSPHDQPSVCQVSCRSAVLYLAVRDGLFMLVFTRALTAERSHFFPYFFREKETWLNFLFVVHR